jgi:ribosomal protein L16/L10AE
MDDDTPLPFVVGFNTGTLPDNDVCLQLRFATADNQTADAIESAVYAMDRKTAKQLAAALQTASTAEHPLTKR